MVVMILRLLMLLPSAVRLTSKRLRSFPVCAFLFLLLSGSSVDAQIDANPGKIGVGLNYPGLGVRALVMEKFMGEAKAQYEPEALAAGARLYRYVFPEGRYFPYLGVEADWVRFEDEGVKADGLAGEIFAGVECFIRPKLSFQFDVGPAYIGLENETLSVDGVQFIVNFGITYYLMK